MSRPLLIVSASLASVASLASIASLACVTAGCGGVADLGDERTDAATTSSSAPRSASMGSAPGSRSSQSSSASTFVPGTSSSAPAGSATSGSPPATSSGPTSSGSAASAAPGATSALLYCAYSTATTPTTWTWNGSAWKVDASTLLPPTRLDSAMAWDGHEILLFGGSDPQTNDLLSDTWAWSGGAWTQLHPATSPPARSFHTLATLGDTVVLFGGWSGTEDLADTWIWDGTTWSEASPATSPPARDFAQAATANGLAYLFGGGIGAPNSGLPSSTYLNDTWAWDGHDWSNVTTTDGLTGQWSFGMTAFEGKLVVFQQNEDNAQAPVSSYVLQASGWQLTPSTYAMSHFAGSSAAGVDSQVVFAGRTLDTIAWNGTTWTDVGQGPDLDSCDNGLMMSPMP